MWRVQDSYVAESVAPVYENQADKTNLHGFISRILDITPMLLYSLGIDPDATGRAGAPDTYRVGSSNEETAMTGSSSSRLTMLTYSLLNCTRYLNDKLPAKLRYPAIMLLP